MKIFLFDKYDLRFIPYLLIDIFDIECNAWYAILYFPLFPSLLFFTLPFHHYCVNTISIFLSSI